MAAGVALVIHFRHPTAGMGTLATAIVAVILLNGVFAFAQEYRAKRTLAALERLLPARSRVLRGTKVVLVEVERLVPGDIVLLSAGDAVPADARLLEVNGLRVDLATLSGEAEPRPRHVRPAEPTSALEAPNLVLAGTGVLDGEGRAVVFATGAHTEFGTLAALAQAEPEPRSAFLLEIGRVSRWIATLAVGAVFLVTGLAVGLGPSGAGTLALGIIVANLPEDLLPTVTLALAMAPHRLARKGVLVRHVPAIEALGGASVILTDKTGTPTTGRMRVGLVEPTGAAGPVGTDALDPSAPARLSLARPLGDPGRGRRLYQRASEGRVALPGSARAGRRVLPGRHDCHARRDRARPDRQPPRLSRRVALGLRARPAAQPAPPARSRAGSGADPPHRLHDARS